MTAEYSSWRLKTYVAGNVYEITSEIWSTFLSEQKFSLDY